MKIDLVIRRDYWVSKNGKRLTLEQKKNGLDVYKGQGITKADLLAIPEEEILNWFNKYIIIEKKRKIQKGAKKRIFNLIPDKFGITDPIVSEINMLMHVSYLLNKKIDNTVSSEELEELNTIISLKENIDSIRQVSKDMQIDVETEIDPSVYEIETNPLWP